MHAQRLGTGAETLPLLSPTRLQHTRSVMLRPKLSSAEQPQKYAGFQTEQSEVGQIVCVSS